MSIDLPHWVPAETRDSARSSGRTVPGGIPSPTPPGTANSQSRELTRQYLHDLYMGRFPPRIYGVFNPSFPVDWEPCSMATDEACAAFFRRRGVPADFGVPTHAVIWADGLERIGGAVAHYHNGKAAVLRLSGITSTLSFEDIWQ